MKQRGYQLGQWSRFGIVIGIIFIAIIVPPSRSLLGQLLQAGGLALHRVSVAIRISPPDSSVAKENNDLRQINSTLLKQVETLKSGLEAGGALDRIQTFLSSNKLQGVATAIIGYSDDPAVKTFSIALGQLDGVRIGMAVVSDSGVVVGKVIETQDHISVVRDIHDSESTILARVENTPKSQGVIHGQQGITLKISFIPKDDPVAIGDVVATSGTENLIPPGIPIGTVTELDTRPGDVFQTATVLSPIRISTLSAVAVVLAV